MTAHDFMKISKPLERYTDKVVLAENGHKTIFYLACAVSKSIIESVRKASVWCNQISNRLSISKIKAESDFYVVKL